MVDEVKQPIGFWNEIKRRKVIRVVAAYIAIAFVAIELFLIVSPLLNLPSWILPLIIVLLSVGFIISVIVAWIWDKTPEGIVKTKPSQEVESEVVEKMIHSNEWKVTTYISLIVIAALVVFHIFSGNKRSHQITEKGEITVEPITDSDYIYLIVENMPKFEVEGYRDFREYIMKEINYPENSREKGIGGRVFVQFVVRSDGSVDEVKVVRGINEELDAEAIRIIQSSPKWKPGTQKDKAVNVSYSFPVVFSLE